MYDQDDVLELFYQICAELDSCVADVFSSVAQKNTAEGAEAATETHFGDLFVSYAEANYPPVNRRTAQMSTLEMKRRRLLQFWIDRVTQALDTLHRDSVESDHMAASETLGVVWTGQSRDTILSPIISPRDFDNWKADDWYCAIKNV